MSWPRLVETVRRLRPSQLGHRVARRLRSLGPPPVGPAVGAWVGLPPLPAEAARPAGFPWDRPDGDGWRFAGARATPRDAGLQWDAPPTALQQYHAAYAEVVAHAARGGRLPEARRWLAAARAGAPEHPYVRARRALALTEAVAHGLGDAVPVVLADAAALARELEWDVRGNHLVANGAALVRVGGATRGAAGRRFARTGAAVLAACAREQALGDGVHYERSPVYQALVLEHLLVALETAAVRGEPPPRGVEAAAARLATGLEELTLPDGGLVRWRDGAPGFALGTPALVQWAQRRAGPLAPPRTGSRTFPVAGFAVVARGDADAVTLVGAPPCPRDLPAHGHADALAFEAVLGGVRVVAASGTAAYGAGPARDADRRPGAFAGLRVDGGDAADPWGAFRVGARGWVRHLETGTRRGWPFAAAHASFHRAAAGVVARRTVAWTTAGALVVLDEVVGPGAHRVERAVPLGPDLTARVDGDGVLVEGRGGVWRLAAPGAALRLETGRYAVAVGAEVPRTVVWCTTTGPLPARLGLVVAPGPAPVTLDVAPILGGEVRVQVGGPGRDEAGYLPAGQRP